MTEQEYRKHPAISRSELFRMRETPEKFKHYKDNPESPTPALIFGQYFHALVLQPETVEIDFIIAPTVDRRTKAGKEAYAEFEAKSESKTIVTAEMAKMADGMCKALEKNAFVQKLLQGEKEVPFFWTDELTGEECKCRVDCLTEIGEYLFIVDLKSTENAESDAFMRSAIDHGYDFQSAFYNTGVEICKGKKPIFVFIAVEKKPPYALNILQADELFVKRGFNTYRQFLDTYHECKTTDNWWGYMGKNNQINNLYLPSYLVGEI